MISDVEILLDEKDCPNLFCNPFQADKVQDIDIRISKRFKCIQKGFPVKATVSMQNQETYGTQHFYGDDLMSVVVQVDAFIKQLSGEKNAKEV